MSMTLEDRNRISEIESAIVGIDAQILAIIDILETAKNNQKLILQALGVEES